MHIAYFSWNTDTNCIIYIIINFIFYKTLFPETKLMISHPLYLFSCNKSLHDNHTYALNPTTP